MPVVAYEMDEDEAAIIMVDTNLEQWEIKVVDSKWHSLLPEIQ